MKWCSLWLAMLLVLAVWGWAQDEPPQSQQPQPRPTLGPAPAPSLEGPRTSTTTDARKLLRVRNIYVERIDNSLSDRLIEDLAKLGRFRVVSKRSEADAVLRGTCSDFRRLKAVRSEVYLTDRVGASIWQDSVRRPFNPPALDKAVTETAQVVVQHLGASIREAQQK